MKSGWHVEWDAQVRYAAPMRSALSHYVEMFKPFVQAVNHIHVALTVSASKVAEAINKMTKSMQDAER